MKSKVVRAIKAKALLEVAQKYDMCLCHDGSQYEKIIMGVIHYLREQADLLLDIDNVTPEYWERLGKALEAATKLPDQVIDNDPPTIV